MVQPTSKSAAGDETKLVKMQADLEVWRLRKLCQRQLTYLASAEAFYRAKFSANDLPAAIRSYREFKADPVNRYAATSWDIYWLGKRLIDEKRFEQAIEVLKLNVESYPKLWVSYDTLAEAYMKSGNKELAIKNYKKSLELQPFNDGTRHILKSLGVE